MGAPSRVRAGSTLLILLILLTLLTLLILLFKLGRPYAPGF